MSLQAQGVKFGDNKIPTQAAADFKDGRSACCDHTIGAEQEDMEDRWDKLCPFCCTNDCILLNKSNGITFETLKFATMRTC